MLIRYSIKRYSQGNDDSQMEELQRLAEVGRLSAHLLHQISNPVTATLLYLDQNSKDANPGTHSIRRNMRLLRRYVETARRQLRQESRPVHFSVGHQLEEVRRLVRPAANAHGVDLAFDPVVNCKLFGDPVKFQHIMTNLVMNAIEAYEGDLYPELAKPVRVTLKAQRRYVTIRVIDWGKGISDDQLPKLFKPFYTTKQSAGRGLGIGLAMVDQYVRKDFKGSISIASSRRHGTQFILRLPLP